MLYINTHLDALDFPDDSPDVVLHHGRPYYRPTPRVWAWVLQRGRKARDARDAGRLPADAYDRLCARVRDLRAALPPFPDGPLAAALAAPQTLPDPPPSLAPNGSPYPPDDAVAAIAERAYHEPPDWSDGPAQVRESVVVRCEGFPTVALSPGDDRLLFGWQEGLAAAAVAPAPPDAPKRPRQALLTDPPPAPAPLFPDGPTESEVTP